MVMDPQDRRAIPKAKVLDSDFNLLQAKMPREDLEPKVVLQSVAYPSRLKIETLCAAIQSRCDLQHIREYLQSYRSYNSKFKNDMTDYAWAALYYAVSLNSTELVQLLLEYGADPCKMQSKGSLPLLAFAILYSKRMAIDTTGLVRLLLASGIDPCIIPEDMWRKFLDTPKLDGPYATTGPSAWCTGKARKQLAPALHLTFRYLLYRASRIGSRTARELQIASQNRMVNLLRMPYYIVGQMPAAAYIMEAVFTHIALRKKMPLAMAFVGPSGHGKTETARQLGDMLSVDYTVIDCAQMKHAFDLFGSTAGYVRSEEGSQLNNFLGDHTAEQSVVFLDEFDKTTQDIRESLLLMLDQGEYNDRRFNRCVDCSRTIWVIATNYGDQIIKDFYSRKVQDLGDDRRDHVDLSPLQSELEQAFTGKFGAPFTGRLSLIVPFLPFSLSESAVVTHKFILDFAENVRQPIDLRDDVSRTVGHIGLSFYDDGTLCSKLAERFYRLDLGARSLSKGVDTIEAKLVHLYGKTSQLITEKLNDGPLQRFDVRLVKQGRSDDVEVFPGRVDEGGSDDEEEDELTVMGQDTETGDE